MSTNISLDFQRPYIARILLFSNEFGIRKYNFVRRFERWYFSPCWVTWMHKTRDSRSHSVTRSQRLLNLPAKRKFRERARNFYRKWKHLVRNKLLRCQTWHQVAWHGHRNFATGDRSQLTLRLAIRPYDCSTI